MIVEEVFINIANYAYGKLTGKAWIDLSLDKDSHSLVMTFRDKGTPYNPLEKETPDISSPAEMRSIGGLGIFMVKKNMDEVGYAYENGQNVLTMRRKIGV